MKKLVPFLLAGALALPVASVVVHHAFAQDGSHDCGPRGHGGGHHGRGHHGRGHHGNPAEHVAERTRMLTAILDLNATQQAEVQRILTAAATEAQTIHQQPEGEARHQAMQALHERTKLSIAAVLTPAQRATMERVEAAREANRARPQTP